LYEVEDGRRYTINRERGDRPVADYLALQRRYKDIDPVNVAILQDEVDEGWRRLRRQVEMGAS
jgi:hypothetical protein